MRRWLFNAVAGASILLWIVTISTGIVCHFRQYLLSGTTADRLVYIHFNEYGVAISIVRGWPNHEKTSWVYSPTGKTSRLLIPGVYAGNKIQRVTYLPGLTMDIGPLYYHDPQLVRPGLLREGTFVEIAWLWPMLVMTPGALFFGIWIVRKRLTRNRRIAAGECLMCGYDLRASPERCPECGTIPPQAMGAAI